jgi:pterin-4a-carbinolamine dehydratase
VKSMKALHEDLMRKAEYELPGVHRLPVRPQEPVVPIIPQNRWELARDDQGCSHLSKTYRFMSIPDRNNFVREMLTYEEEFEHTSSMVINDLAVTLTISTKSIGVTEIDKDYARYADETFKDVTFNV